MKKAYFITILTIVLSSLFADTASAQQNFHFRKGREYASINWERSAFSEWEKGMNAGEMTSTIMVAVCYMREYGTGKNVSKGVQILENLATKHAEAAIFVANFWFPTLDNDPFVNYKPHIGGQYNCWSLTSWWQEPDLKSTKFGLQPDYSKVIKYSKMFLAKVSQPGYGRSLAANMIGYCYENGLGGVSKSLDKAMEYYSYSKGVDFYNIATQTINKATTREETEAIMSKIKPYLDLDKDYNKRLREAIENKDESKLSVYNESSAAEKAFVLAYIDKYYTDEYKKVDEWWTVNDPLVYPENFHAEYENLTAGMKREVDKRFNELLVDTQRNYGSWTMRRVTNRGMDDQTHGLAENYSKLLTAYPDSWNNPEKKRQEFAEYWCKLATYDIESTDSLSYEEKIEKLSALKELPIPLHYSSLSQSIDDCISRCEDGIAQPISEVFLRYSKVKYDPRRHKNVINNWDWRDDNVPSECRPYNMSYGSSLRDSGRQRLLEEVDKMMPAIHEILRMGESQFKKYSDRVTAFVVRSRGIQYSDYYMDVNFSVETVASTIMLLYYFSQIIQKEDDGTITMSDYTDYLEKYPDTYYKQYCKDAIAMMTADTYTLNTSKEEIKALLNSGITEGAANYIESVTKKSYLKTKSR